MMNDLLDYDCIDWKKLLLLKGKSLKLSDQECYILLLIMTMNEINMKPINPQNVSKLSSLSLKELDQVLLTLLDKHMISRNQGLLSLKPLYQKLLEQDEDVDEDVDLYAMFENAFGRSLNQMEMGIIQSFMSQGYDDVMIMDALNEAVKSGVLNFRYIEKILMNWSQYGVKKRFAPSPQVKVDDVDQKIKDLKWWETNE